MTYGELELDVDGVTVLQAVSSRFKLPIGRLDYQKITLPSGETTMAKKTIAAELKSRGAKIPTKRKAPLWEGPESSGEQGGITQSLLSRFLVCRERFRLLVVEGMKPNDEFNVRLEYGNLWHACEEGFARKGGSWLNDLVAKAKELASRYPTQAPQIEHWYNVCKIQFPIYVDYWKKHPDVVKREPLFQEEQFKVPYRLPSGRIVWLRSKLDSVDLIREDKKPYIWIQENKTKGDIDEHLLQRQLTFDLQTMFYKVIYETLQAVARGEIEHEETEAILPLDTHFGNVSGADAPIKGVRYNVIRRPLAGGKHSIRQHQPTKSNPEGESSSAFYERLGGLIKEDAPYFFMRWNVEISEEDTERFKRECLNPILEQLCDWYDHISLANEDGLDLFGWGSRPGIHFRFPFGVYNPMLEGRASEVDEYLASGSEVGLTRVDDLFPELKEAE